MAGIGPRGQAHTLEAVAAGLLLLSSVVFALQVTAVTPLTGSTSSQHIENQQAAVAEGLLASEAHNGTITPTLLYWNGSGNTAGRFWGASTSGYENSGPPTAFGSVLNRSLSTRGIAFNVNVYFLAKDGSRKRRQLVHLGSPSDHASAARRTVTLHDDDALLAADGSERAERLGDDAGNYFAPDVAPVSNLYNVVEVEVVVWRM